MSVSTYQYEDIVHIICEINDLHYSFSNKLSNLLSFNLKKSVSSVVVSNSIDSDFQELINSYKKELNSIVGRLSDIQNKFVGIRSRIKQAESISEKLLYYMTDVHEFGKVPLNKCLNDFLGFRILVIDLESVYGALKCDNRVTNITKMYLRTDGDYSGIHLYFKNGNNKFFPWELQIWDIEQSSSNEKSHKEHKQKRKYIDLPQNYHEAKLEKED
ncbi:hypothetical protein RYQ61_03630 [Streptococcus intermedius]|uniref:hypothetical protein n=1 Tax=Streptococcus intermedius TaxID=1338 RepID=UPI002943BD26|nr:hypothetical protein [Streptococcus intermedius]WOI91918.1 hypothetical protein RYQ61_03630 [Streptococcus intermedius]